MVAAMPYIDEFIPVHNLVSIEQLGKMLATMRDEKRSPRRAAKTAPPSADAEHG
jgi:hypothetical protein